MVAPSLFGRTASSGSALPPADETAMDALDAHLTTYLVPDVGEIYGRTATTIGTKDSSQR